MLEFLLKIVIGSTVILCIAFMLEPFFKRGTARTRHTLWVATLFGLLAFPLMSPFLPSVPLVKQVADIPEPQIETQVEPHPEPQPFFAPEPVTEMPIEFSQREFATSYSPREFAFEAAPVTETPAEVASTMPEEIIEETPENAKPILAVTLIAIWAFGAILLTIRLLASVAALRKLARQCVVEEDERTLELLEKTRLKFHVTRKVTLLRSEAVQVPFASGLMRASIFLPMELETETPRLLPWVLMHEMVHVARCDTCWQLLSQLARIVYWFHPLVWFVGKRMQTERELACDQRVLQTENEPEQYAAVLLDMSESVRRQRAFFPACAVAMAQTHPVEQRIREILDFRPERVSRRFGGVMVILVTLLSTVMAAALTPVETRLEPPLENAVTETTEEEKPVEPAEPVAPVVAAAVSEEISVPIEIELPEGVDANEVEIYVVQTDETNSTSAYINANYGGLAWAGKPALHQMKTDCNYVFWAFTKDGKYVSEFTTLVKPNRSSSMHLTLEKGVSLSGTLKDTSGNPLAEHEVQIRCDVVDVSVDNTIIPLEFRKSIKTKRDGTYAISLPSGYYSLRASDMLQSEENLIFDLQHGQGKVIDLTIRDPFYVRLTHADGSPVFETTQEGTSRHVLSGLSWKEDLPPEGQKLGPFSIGSGLTVNDEGNIRVIPYEKSNFLLYVTPDGEEALLHNFTDLKYESGQVITQPLQAAVKVKFRLLDHESKKPLSHLPLRCPIRLMIPGKPTGLEPLNINPTTDKDGYVTVSVPALGEYVKSDSLRYFVHPELEEPQVFVFSHKATFAPETPGEEIDLGVFEIVTRPKTTGKTLTRTVLLPDGKPASGVSVCFGTSSLRLSPPKLMVIATGPPASTYMLAKTDEHGKFSIAEPAEKDYQICFVHPDGYTQVSNKVFTTEDTFTLQKYASLEIRIPYDTKPGASNVISLGPPSTPLSRVKDPTLQQVEYQARIPENGIVKFDKIAPGHYSMSSMAHNATDTWYYSTMNVSVTLTPGEATTLDLCNEENVRVKGWVRLPKDYTEEFTEMDWSQSFVELISDVKVPEDQRRQYCVTLAPSKTDPRESGFEFENIAPGDWNLRITLQKCGKEVIFATRTIGTFGDHFTIPSPEADDVHPVHFLPTIVAESMEPEPPKPQEIRAGSVSDRCVLGKSTRSGSIRPKTRPAYTENGIKLSFLSTAVCCTNSRQTLTG